MCKAYDARVPGKGFGLADLACAPTKWPTGKGAAIGKAPPGGASRVRHSGIVRDFRSSAIHARLDADVAALRAAGLPEG